MQKNQLILASTSPRRRRLLKQAGFIFSILPSKIVEATITHSSPEKNAQLLAKAKAEDVAQVHPQSWVIGADTIVSVSNKILGKPASDKDAHDMLTQLSGKSHRVYTGFAIRHHDQGYLFSESICTTVQFKTLTPGEIKWYLATKEPFDKAGAYAIQGKGAFMIKRINGSYTNVVGLPVSNVVGALAKVGLADHLLA